LAQYKDGVLPKYTKHKPGSYKLAAFGVCGLAALGGGLRYLMSRKNKAALE
ncbi:hypothetical protein NEAUS03_2535, partial [Nematocida ausubeli]